MQGPASKQDQDSGKICSVSPQDGGGLCGPKEAQGSRFGNWAGEGIRDGPLAAHAPSPSRSGAFSRRDLVRRASRWRSALRRTALDLGTMLHRTRCRAWHAPEPSPDKHDLWSEAVDRKGSTGCRLGRRTHCCPKARGRGPRVG